MLGYGMGLSEFGVLAGVQGSSLKVLAFLFCIASI